MELHRNEIPLQITFTFRGQGSLYISLTGLLLLSLEVGICCLEKSSCTYGVSYFIYLRLICQSRNQSCLTVRSGKKSSNQESGLGNRGRLKVLNDTKLILNDQEGNSGSFSINLVPFKTFRSPLYMSRTLLKYCLEAICCKKQQKKS